MPRKAPRNIAAVNCSLAEPLKSLGAYVLPLRLGPGTHDLPALLEKHGFVPDMIVHQERLDCRVILSGLERCPCSKVFWSIDPHLNSFWQRRYATLFDGLLITQSRHVAAFKTIAASRIGWLPWFGESMPFVEHARRPLPFGFVGRLGKARVKRKHMLRLLLERHSLKLRLKADFQAMLAFYRQTRIVPNEAIASEVNFRTFEAASCGCLVLNEKVGDELWELFTPGREIQIFGDALELLSLAKHYASRPDETERLGRAARERILAEHLPIHRAKSLLDFTATLSQSNAQGAQADADLSLSLYELVRTGSFNAPLSGIIDGLARNAVNPEALAALIVLCTETKRPEDAKAIMLRILTENSHACELDVNLAGSLCAMRIGQAEAARAFLLRAVAASSNPPAKLPADPFEQLLFWASELTRQGELCRPGFSYDPEKHVPRCAIECLVAAHALKPSSQILHRRMDGVLRSIDGGTDFRLDVLARLSVFAPNDWRAACAFGREQIRGFRLGEGLETLDRAFKAACAAGKKQDFLSHIRNVKGLAEFFQDSDESVVN